MLDESPFERVVRSQQRPGYVVEPVAISWEAVAFAVRGQRHAIACIPRNSLAAFFDDLDAGRLDEPICRFLASPPSGRVLRASDQTHAPGLFDSLDSPNVIVPPERPPGRPERFGPGGGTPIGPRHNKRSRRPRPRRLLIGAAVATVVLAAAAVAFAARTGNNTTQTETVDRSVTVPVTPVTAISTSTTSTPATTALAASPRDITSFGTVSATTTFGGDQFPAQLSVDGDPTTSWFSAGPRAGSTVFAWEISGKHRITSITIVGNARNATPSFRTGFGFGHVDIVIRDSVSNPGVNTVNFRQGFDGPGNSVPQISFNPDVNATSVELTFTGHESPDCGGFSELTIIGT